VFDPGALVRREDGTRGETGDLWVVRLQRPFDRSNEGGRVGSGRVSSGVLFIGDEHGSVQGKTQGGKGQSPKLT